MKGRDEMKRIAFLMLFAKEATALREFSLHFVAARIRAKYLAVPHGA
jgi:23S rRNA-/tRNA-specific pseudouridylate synthase